MEQMTSFLKVMMDTVVVELIILFCWDYSVSKNIYMHTVRCEYPCVDFSKCAGFLCSQIMLVTMFSLVALCAVDASSEGW